MRQAARTDSNQKQIVEQLRKTGVSVYITSMVGKGFPDLLVGYKNKNYLFELKDEKKYKSQKQLTEDEKKFFGTWRGQVNKVENLNEILEIIGM